MFASRFLSRALRSVALAAAFAAPALASATVVYSQPFTPTNAYFASSLAGVSDYDSFSLSSDATITTVDWSGYDLNELIPGTVINPTSFVVNFYSNGRNGQPGTLLSSSTIGNSGNAVSTGFMFEGEVTEYVYSGTLATPFHATAGQSYWIEINDPTTNADWFWATGSGPDASHLGTFPGEGTQTYSDDLQFTLSNVAAVPEPASWALFLLGGAGLVGMRAMARGRREG